MKEVTFCLTSCNRWNLLEKTLDSFLKLNSYPIERYLLHEDSGNTEIVSKIKEKYPFIEVFESNRSGLLASVDKLYALVDTPYIFHCFRAETHIETLCGSKKISEIQIGDLVKTHNNRFRPVVKLFTHPADKKKPCYWVKTSYSITKTTSEHPFLTICDTQITWKKCEELSINDCLLYPVERKQSVISLNCKDRWNTWTDLEVDEDMAKFLGLYLAEGCGGHDSIRLYFNNNEKDLQSFVVDFCTKTFKRKPTVYSKWATVIKLNIRSFSKVFTDWFGKEATVKRIPSFVFEWDIINKLSFINGYILGDGCTKNKGGAAVIVTASKQLSEDFIKLCNSCGLKTSNVDNRKPSTSVHKGVTISGKGAYAVRLPNNSWGKLQDILFSEKIEGYSKIPIKSITLKKQFSFQKTSDTNWYNLEVEEDNSYIANSAIVHNCEDDWYFSGNKNFMEESVRVLEERPDIHQVWIRKGIPKDWIEPLIIDNKYQIVKSPHLGVWSGFSFNPSLRRLKDYQMFFPDGFNIFKDKTTGLSELNCNNHVAKKNYRAALLLNPACEHIGDNFSTWK